MSKNNNFKVRDQVIFKEHNLSHIGFVISFNKNHSKYVVRTTHGSFNVKRERLEKFDLNKTLNKMKKEQENNFSYELKNV